MVEVHTIFESSGWCNKVDGLRQGPRHPNRSPAVAEGRGIAVELHGAHYVHDVDGRVVDLQRFGTTGRREWVDPVRYAP